MKRLLALVFAFVFVFSITQPALAVDRSAAEETSVPVAAMSVAEHAGLGADVLAHEWVGEYDGHSGEVVVRRNYRLHVTDVSVETKGQCPFVSAH